LLIDSDAEKLQRCRCAECETGRQRGCNSSRLKELLGSLFANDEASADVLPGLYCRKTKGGRESTAEEAECLCAECDLAEGEEGYFCAGKYNPSPLVPLPGERKMEK
jgi:hypothetical protein